MIHNGRTHEDEIADKDEDWVKARNSPVAWSHRQMDDGPREIHESRAQNVHQGEANDPQNYE